MDIDPESQLPFLVADLLDLLERGLVRRIVDQDVDATELSHRVVHDLAAMRSLLDVARDQQAFAAGLLDPARRLLGIIMLAEISDHQIGAVAGEGYGGRATDAAVAARDDRPLPGQAARAAVRGLAMVGHWFHVTRGAWHLLLLLGQRLLFSHERVLDTRRCAEPPFFVYGGSRSRTHL